jgi:NSS family neurotransmitter:Na+ symporter
MPLLFVILIALCCKTLSLPGAGEGLKFFLSPDFSKITPAVFVNAIGQTFFSLSLGMGILITYSAYYPDSTKLSRTSLIVSVLSLLVAVLMGFIIFPAVKTFGLDNQSLEGATLVFVTLPEVFAQLPGTQLWSILFFALLLVAALTSTVSIAEVSVSFISEHFKLSRTKACLIVMLPLFIFSTLCALSFGPLEYITIFGLNIFNFLDTLSTNILLPIVSIGVCLYVGWFAPKNLLPDQLSNHGTVKSHVTNIVTFVVKYLAPIMIAAILISYFC